MLKNNLPTLNSVVAKHNSLLPQLAKLELSELRLLAYCLSHYNSRKGTDETYETQKNKSFKATVKNLLEIFPHMDEKSAYAVTRKAVLSINQKPFHEILTHKNGKQEEVLTFWFSEFRYLINGGEFTFSLTPQIVDKFLNLDANFTMFRLKDVYQFKSATTWKVYELLKQWLRIGNWSVSLDELKFLLDLAGQYNKWSELKRRVIETSLKEINELSDIFIEYTPTKRSRKITGIDFIIKAQETKINLNYSESSKLNTETNQNIRLLIDAGISKINAINLSELAIKANKDLKVFFTKITERYDKKNTIERQKYKSKQAYLYSALYSEFIPLFDNLGSTKQEIEKQKKTSIDNNKYGREAINCENFKSREAGGKCTIIKPRTKKCQACLKMI